MFFKRSIITLLIVLTFFAANSQQSDDYSFQESMSLFVNGDYKECIAYGYNYIFNSPRKAENGEMIMLMALNAYSSLKDEVQLQVFDLGLAKENRDKVNDLYDELGDYAEAVDKIAYYIEAVYEKRFKDRSDIQTYQYWKQYQINYLLVLMCLTEDKDDEKALKSALKDFHKYVVPMASSEMFSPSERLDIMTTELLYLNSSDAKTNETIDFVYSKLMPAFIEYARSADVEPFMLSSKLNMLKACVSIVNSNLRDDNHRNKLKGADIDVACDLNIMYKTLEQFINGARAYKPLLGKGWRDVQSRLPADGVANELVVCNESTDSFIFSFVFNATSKHPEFKYLGHSYMTDSDLSRYGLDDEKSKNHIFFSCPSEMAFYSPEAGFRSNSYRLHTLAELCVQRPTRPTYGGMVSMADINYSHNLRANSEISTSKGVVNTARLNGAARELQFLKQTFGQQLATLDGDNATKSAFLQIATQPITILHISTHGYYDKNIDKRLTTDNLANGLSGENTLRSCGLKLSGYNDNSPEGCITAYEISKLDLSNIELVFLDACQTGDGKVVNGVPHSLAEAFHRAGVPNIIATTDEIRDDDATQFCITFFKNVATGMSYHDAFYATPQPWRYNKSSNENYRPRTDDAVKQQTGGIFILWE